MTAVQSNRLAMYNAVVEFLKKFADSSTATSLLPALAAKLATLITLVDHLVALAAAQEQPLQGKLQDREQALADAREATLIVAGAVLSYARTHRQHDIAAQVRRVRTEFWRKRRSEQMRIAQRVHDTALPLAAELVDYGLTAGMLDDLQATIAATEQAVNVPVSAKAVKKVSTQQLVHAFAEVEQRLSEIDPLLLKLRKVDPEAHALYRTARTVFDRRGGRLDASDAAPQPVPAQTPAETKLAA